MGCFQYAAEHNGRFPGDLAELVVKDYIEPKTLRSPFNDAPPPRLVDGKLVGESDYALAMPGMRMDRIRRTADMPLVMEKIDEDEYDPQRGAGVAFADGHAEWVTGDAERLRKRIQSALQLGK
jgi:prepilin-type processing-associated H-X9-DG protein